MDANYLGEVAECPSCSKDMTLQESLRWSIDIARGWFAAHPCCGTDAPSLNNIKQMLTEGCDFASVVADCVVNGQVVPAYANLRHLMERAHYTLYFLFTDGVAWENQSVARKQQILERKMQNASSQEQTWVEEFLEKIRYWNRQPDEDGKPAPMRKPRAYKFDSGDMRPHMKEWYDSCSHFVHPTYSGIQNVGRPFLEGEANRLVREAHLYLCASIALCARSIEAAVHPK